MSLQQPDTRPTADGEYIVWRDYIYIWTARGHNQRIIVPAGFTCDAASVPWFLRWFFERDGLQRAAAIVHDWIYSHRGDVPSWSHQYWNGTRWEDVDIFMWTRKDADRLFGRMLREAGVKKRRWAYRAVRLFGWYAWRT